MEQKINKGDVVITSNNVKKLGECIAISAVKYAMRFTNGTLDKIYHGLVHDVFSVKLVNESFSDGYDYAQDAICFLCSFIGKKLNDTYKIDKHRNNITIFRAVTRMLHVKLLNKRISTYTECEINRYNCTQIFEDFEQIEEHKQAIKRVDEMIGQMKLIKGELDTLNCYMGGMTFYDIADLLEVNRSTVYKRRLNLQRKYNQTFNTNLA